ncbi:leucyl/phenylalanyl-tRNA--protein transferase [Janibacter cremeus]|uniref:Leucyl/phenylalanyl-tRNA--protein transferase n=1 Tax=Janibacter cremeus TaxID=1285192 RepID=A0A852VL99_9MICO|nr:leucyl/phenylalanyl-tRNA--protein transferase [Janibacter cremeus]NYF96836.1 leucyl/phenylalanyl-tRNA--protein transferase [Janibacter cremeus]
MTAPFPPIEPPGGATLWANYLRAGIGAADAGQGDAGEVVGVGGRLDPLSVLTAYRLGVFPMGLGDRGGPPMGWWCPRWRGVLVPGQAHVSRSLRRSLRGFSVTVDQSFREVVAACADPDRDGAWISDAVAEVYADLHELGWAHSIEVRDDTGALVGGLYGLAVGGLFAGESMFHHATDASKAALVHLDRIIAAAGDQRRIIDVQWRTRHLGTLGIQEIHRREYLMRLPGALQAPAIDFGRVG